MRAMPVLSAAAAAAVLLGCNKPQDDLEMTYQTTPSDSYSMYDTGTYPTETSGEDTWSSTTTVAAAPLDSTYASYGAGGGQVHVVQRRDTLYGLARSYYGDASQWKKIYEANNDQISDPNKIAVGMKLIIP